MHWKLTLSYDGTGFHGWQVQPGLRTVQGLLAQALHSITGETVLPQGSGRTDAGVHALAQVASVALSAPIPAANLQRALNRVLPPSVRVLAAEPVDASFHARHSALRKTYQYRIFESCPAGAGHEEPAARLCSPFLAPYAWACRWALHLDHLQAAAALLCGTHDFTSFAACDPESSGGAPNPCKTLFHSQWTREDGLLLYRVTGSGFLHHMVRNLVGTMVEIGRGRLDPGAIAQILQARDRAAAGPTAPAQGLFLQSVEYGAADARSASTTTQQHTPALQAAPEAAAS